MTYILAFVILCFVTSTIVLFALKRTNLAGAFLGILLPVMMFQAYAYFTGGWDQFLLIAIVIQLSVSSIIWLLCWGSFRSIYRDHSES